MACSSGVRNVLNRNRLLTPRPPADGSGAIFAVEVKDDRYANPSTDNRTHEVAIPWGRLAPFKPAANANLGFTLAINEDDGNGRKSTIGWPGGVHLEEANVVGNLILAD